jgi:hypothetical protein
MIWAKLVFGGFGRRGLEAIIALGVLVLATAIVGGSLMVVQGARDAITRAAQDDRPDVVQVKSRFNRAVFETPRSGNLAPLTLPVYEPLIDPDKFTAAEATILARQSFLRNVVFGESFLNVYIFGIDPEKEPQVSTFSVGRGRFLRSDDGAVAVVDRASAQALGVDLGGTFPVRKADGQDLTLTVVGILDRLELRDPPPRTVDAPALKPGSSSVDERCIRDIAYERGNFRPADFDRCPCRSPHSGGCSDRRGTVAGSLSAGAGRVCVRQLQPVSPKGA